MIDGDKNPSAPCVVRYDFNLELAEPLASAQVFRIPELLETILLGLPTKDILLLQRVARSFRHTVQGSVRLRRKLFLEPDWNLEGRLFDAYSRNNRPGRKPENNSLLRRAFPGCYPTITLVIANDGSSNQATFASAGEAHGGGREQWSWDVNMSFPADHAPNCSEAVMYPEASWRKMFLCQPPCTSLYLVRRWQRSRHAAMIREKGVTMGDFFDEATAPLPGCERWQWHQSYISSDRDWHFEGNVRCNSVEESNILTDWMSLSGPLQEFAYSRLFRHGAGWRMALSDEWDPGRAVEFAARTSFT